MQWGVTDVIGAWQSKTIIFPKKFENKCFTVVATVISAYAGNGRHADSWNVNTFKQDSFVMVNWMEDGAFAYTWIAIGR